MPTRAISRPTAGHGRGTCWRPATSSSTGMPAASRGAIPMFYVHMLRDGALAADYNPTELDVAPGDRLEVLGIQGAWLHARDAARGRSGWIPAEKTRTVTAEASRVAPVTQVICPTYHAPVFNSALHPARSTRNGMLGSRSGYVRRVEDIAGDGAGLAVGADWRVGGAVGGAGRRALGCAAGVRHSRPGICARRWKPSTPRRAFRCCMDRTWPLDAGRRRCGRYAPDAALRLLLEGTGLIAQAVGDKAFVLRLRPAPSGGAVSAQARHRRAFEAQLQQRVLDALCRQPVSAPGVHRAALALRVDRQGQIGSVRLLDSTAARRATRRYARPCRACRWASRPAIRARPTWCWCCRARAASRRTAPARPSLPATERE